MLQQLQTATLILCKSNTDSCNATTATDRESDKSVQLQYATTATDPASNTCVSTYSYNATTATDLSLIPVSVHTATMLQQPLT